MSTGRINIEVLGGMLDGEVYTLDVQTRAIRLTATGHPDDAITHLCVRGEDNRAYALHPITGFEKLEMRNRAWRKAIAAMEGSNLE